MQFFQISLPAAAVLLGSCLFPSCADSQAMPGGDTGAPADSTAQAAPSSVGSAAGQAKDGNRFAPGGPITDAQLAEYYVTMACEIDGEDVGTLSFELWTKEAPITTRNFLRLADEGFYDGLKFHRILREFMIQGGCPTGTGTGSSPHGNITAEFSEELERQHGYGVLSMARGGHDVNSASSQFFLCCDESQSVWGLDGKYASFGRLTDGTAALETLANVPTTSKRGEKSVPQKLAKITAAKVVQGAPPKGESIARPEEPVDLKGEPRRVQIQHIVLGFKGLASSGTTSERTEEEAKVLAAELLAKVQGGADMTPLVREYSALASPAGHATPGDFHVLNTGIRDRAAERKQFNLMNKFRKRAEVIDDDFRNARIKRAARAEAMKELQEEFNSARAALGASRTVTRQQLDPGLADAAFTLKVGEAIVIDHDAKGRSIGYRVVKRLK